MISTEQKCSHIHNSLSLKIFCYPWFLVESKSTFVCYERKAFLADGLFILPFIRCAKDFGWPWSFKFKPINHLLKWWPFLHKAICSRINVLNNLSANVKMLSSFCRPTSPPGYDSTGRVSQKMCSIRVAAAKELCVILSYPWHSCIEYAWT